MSQESVKCGIRGCEFEHYPNLDGREWWGCKNPKERHWHWNCFQKPEGYKR